MSKNHRGPNHTSCRRGEKVLIKLINGEQFVDTFIERKNGVIFLKERGRVRKEEMRLFAVYKKSFHNRGTLGA